ncbi:hypothetical protein F5X96DRAFT_317436 [Biscogniauxia mediterranea]|nr:hypothetical protein F5X96DRAFT_317436 [Biscogniauxia mediterranea]
MQSFRGHLDRVGLVALAALARESVASYGDEYQVQWINKDHNVLRHPKRDSSCSLTDWKLCPASVNGGCCPNNYECDVSSCFATTAGPSTGCGSLVGYYDCPLTAGAGSCCPVGFICDGGSNCLPPSDQYSESCPASYFACPSSLGYGCCQNGKICGSGACYDNTPMTLPVSFATTSTESNGGIITTTITTTSVVTPGPNISSGTAAAIGVAKLIPSTVSKQPAISTNSSNDSNNGLSTAALGGIIAAVVVILIAIIIAAVLIIKRLRKTEKAAKAAAESRRDYSSKPPIMSNKSGFGRPSISEVDGVDIDPLTRTRLSPHMRSQSDSTVANRSQSITPGILVSSSGGEGSSRTSSPPIWSQGVFNNILPSDTSDGRQSSLDNYGGGGGGYQSDSNDANNYNNNMQYSQPTTQRVSYDSQTSSFYGRRHWSNASEVAGSLYGAHGVSELDTMDASEAAVRRQSNSSNMTTRPIAAHVRRSSDPPTSTTTRARGDSGATVPLAAQPPLGTVTEIPLELHGHYGPSDLSAGQTAAKPNKGPGSATTGTGENTS